MTDETESPQPDVAPEDGEESEDPGPGWMPAILAACALMGIVGFVLCAFSTWILFQYRTEFAIRTIRGNYLPQIQQSHLDPETKSAVIDEVEALVNDLERGRYENWQAAGAMQRLQRLPVLQWGELQAVEQFVRGESFSPQENREDALRQIARLRRAVVLEKVNAFDFEDLLQPVRRTDESSLAGHTLLSPLTQEAVDEVIHRARLLADRAEMPDEDSEPVQIETLVKEAIQKGTSAGSF